MLHHSTTAGVTVVVAVNMAVAGTLGIVVVKILTPHGLRKPHLNSEEKGKGFPKKPSKSKENICYRCGMKGHWVRTCRTPKHLADLYQASLKEKEKGIETNFVNHNDQIDTTQLDISDFLENPEESYKNMFGN